MGYRGGIKFKFKIGISSTHLVDALNGREEINFKFYNVGERIGQLIILPYPKIQFEEADELSEADRGDKGFGSTGN
jgi:dUTP pyrophosphatase